MKKQKDEWNWNKPFWPQFLRGLMAVLVVVMQIIAIFFFCIIIANILM